MPQLQDAQDERHESASVQTDAQNQHRSDDADFTRPLNQRHGRLFCTHQRLRRSELVDLLFAVFTRLNHAISRPNWDKAFHVLGLAAGGERPLRSL
jgi:hypothetical protein